jgi:hypothetical protein
MSWWEPDQMEMARLQYIIMSSWDNETRRNTVDTLASYGKKALPSLTNVGYSLLWNPEIKQYVLDKAKQINEGAI